MLRFVAEQLAGLVHKMNAPARRALERLIFGMVQFVRRSGDKMLDQCIGDRAADEDRLHGQGVNGAGRTTPLRRIP